MLWLTRWRSSTTPLSSKVRQVGFSEEGACSGASRPAYCLRAVDKLRVLGSAGKREHPLLSIHALAH